VALVQDITLASRAAVGALVQQSTNAVGPGWGAGGTGSLKNWGNPGKMMGNPRKMMGNPGKFFKKMVDLG